MSLTSHTKKVKEISARLGFDYCGISTAAFLDEDARRLEQWLRAGMHGSMSYMENYFDLRTDPRKLVAGAKSVITVLINYYPSEKQNDTAPKVSKYAYGKDYHDTIRGKLNEFFFLLREEIGEISGRGFVDSAPVLERSWAQRSGLGFIGRNGNLINRQAGSFFFIASLITDLELISDDPVAKDYCGTCTRCIDQCPTEAIMPDKVVDGSKCISYFTIELKDALMPDQMKGKFDNWLFGCDVCQDVCPWNSFSTPSKTELFMPIAEVLNYTAKDWEELTEEKFKIIFSESPLKRRKFAGIKRNLQFIMNDEQQY